MELRASKLCLVVDKSSVNRRASVGTNNANSSRFQSRSTEFARQLQKLVADLNETTSHFIRCIKPNQVQQPALVNRTHVLGQMRHGGLMSALEMMHSGYPTRCPYDTIYKRFSALLSTTGHSSVSRLQSLAPKEFTHAIMCALQIGPDEYQLGMRPAIMCNIVSSVQSPSLPIGAGLTRLFLRANRLAFLEDILAQGGGTSTAIIDKVLKWLAKQRLRRAIWSVVAHLRISTRLRLMRAGRRFYMAVRVRGLIAQTFGTLLAQKRCMRQAKANNTLRRAMRHWLAMRAEKIRNSGATTIGRFIRGWSARRQFAGMIADARKKRALAEQERLRQVRRGVNRK